MITKGQHSFESTLLIIDFIRKEKTEQINCRKVCFCIVKSIGSNFMIRGRRIGSQCEAFPCTQVVIADAGPYGIVEKRKPGLRSIPVSAACFTRVMFVISRDFNSFAHLVREDCPDRS